MALVDLIEAIARQAVEAMLNGLWQGTALVALVWCLLKMIPRTNATTRHVIWWGTLIAVICLPVVASRALLITDGDIEPLTYESDIFETSHRRDTEYPEAAQRNSLRRRGNPLAGRAICALCVSAVNLIPSSSIQTKAAIVVQAQEAPEQRRPEQIEREQISPAPSFFPVRLPGRWAIFFFAAWIVIVFVMMGRVVWSYCHLRRLKRNCLPPPQHCHEKLKRGLAHARLNRPVRLCSSEDTSVPMVIGFMKPVIVIPHLLARELTEEEFEQVVLHEIAHVRRRDDWMKLAQKLIEAFLFFHPAVFWIGRRLNLEREIACDDSVIFLTGKARPYAACLIKLLELTSLRQSSLLAPGAVTIKRQISSRVEMIVDKRRNATLILSKAGLLVMLLAMALVIAEAARISPVLALIEPDTSSFELANGALAQSLKDEFDPSARVAKEFKSDVAATAHTGTPHTSEAIAGNDSGHDSLAQSQFETAPAQPPGAADYLPTQVALWSPVKPGQGSLPEPPHPPTPPAPPNPPAVAPVPPQSVPSPPAPPADGSREARAVYERSMADYNRQVDKYREQVRDYDRSVAEYREQMREYDRQIDHYNNDLKRYYEQMARYNEEMKEYEKRIFAMVPGAVLSVIAEQVAGIDLKLDAGARDKFNRELEQFAATLAKELTEKYKDLKINRPAGHITLVSFLSTAVLRNRLRQFFSRIEIGSDETARAALGVAADRAAPALQSLIVYRWP